MLAAAKLIRRGWAALVLATGLVSLAQADVGLMEIRGAGEADGPVTLFYPSKSGAQPVQRLGFTWPLAWQGEPVRGNGRLVVISHGSGGSPWVHADLAIALAQAGFVVALPEHAADNYRDGSAPGPDSWKRRPLEVSRAIDAVAADARLAPLLALDRVGMFGMSAGGHTALTLAGGRWSPAQYRRHCEAHIADDFQTCAGTTFQLNGGLLDGLKQSLVRLYSRLALRDEAWYSHTDPRIAAIVAGVPFAADFDMASLAGPKLPLGVVTARQDTWLQPKFHSAPLLLACLPRCAWLADLAAGGHGALLSPLPQRFSGVLADLVNDPPGFDRAQQVPLWQAQVCAFFQRQLLP